MRIAVSTGGGDAPGLNAVIRGAVLAAVNRGWECVGIRRGFDGLLGDDEVVPLGPAQVRGITHLGGTILGTTNRGDPFKWRRQRPDGSLTIALQLMAKGIPVVGCPRRSTTTWAPPTRSTGSTPLPKATSA